MDGIRRFFGRDRRRRTREHGCSASNAFGQRYYHVDFRERVGVELPQNPDVKLNSIERTLQFWLRGTSAAERLDKYQRMMTLITSGMLAISVKNYRTYNMVYQDMPADPSWYESYEGDRFYVLFSVKYLEPQPSI